MTNTDSVSSGAIPTLYDRHLGVALFGSYADRVAESLSDLRDGALPEASFDAVVCQFGVMFFQKGDILARMPTLEARRYSRAK